MKQQNPIVVFLLPLVTFGIYTFVWFARTRGEMNRLGASVPTTWLLIVPFVNLYYLWKWCKGAEHVTGGKLSGVLAFILMWFLGSIGMAIAQDSFNNVVSAPSSAAAAAPVAPAGPIV